MAQTESREVPSKKFIQGTAKTFQIYRSRRRERVICVPISSFEFARELQQLSNDARLPLKFRKCAFVTTDDDAVSISRYTYIIGSAADLDNWSGPCLYAG